jgi:DNA-binding transcriptional LysR family regulator
MAIALKPALPEGPSLALLADIFEAGSVTSAARALGSSQPALSKRLQRLEQALGVQVFERNTRGVVPTEYGAALLPRARAIRAQMRQAAEEVAQMRGSREGRVTAALSHLATIALLPQVMPAFRRAWPDVTVAITPPTFQFAGLREGAPDFAVISLPTEHPGAEFATRALYTTRVVVVARPGHPLARARTLAALREAEWILPSADSSTAVALRRAFQRARLGAPRCPVTCETLTGLESLILATDLIGAMPLEVHEKRSAANQLVRLPLEQAIEGPRVAIVRWADARPTPAAAAMADMFVDAGHQLARRRRG